VPDEIRRLWPRLSSCVLGPEEAQALTGVASPEGAAAALVEVGVQTVGLKLGAQGCLLANAAGVHAVPPFEATVVDTTGAGDAFSAGLIFGRLRNLPLSASGTLANALGSLATRVWGAGPVLPGRAEAIHFLRAQFVANTGERAQAIADVLLAIGD
jgi:ribokinase